MKAHPPTPILLCLLTLLAGCGKSETRLRTGPAAEAPRSVSAEVKLAISGMLAVLERGENRLFVEDYCSPRLVLAIKRGGITDEFVEMFRGSSEEMRASLRAAAAGSITVRRSGNIAHSSESFAGEPLLFVQGDNGKWFLEFTEQEYTPEVIYTLF